MIGRRLIHGEVFEHLDDVVLVFDNEIEGVGRVQRAVLDRHGNTVAPCSGVGRIDLKRGCRCRIPIGNGHG